jgi:class 3 adenylate cyclase
MTARHFLPEDLLPLKLLGRIHGSKGHRPAAVQFPAAVMFIDVSRYTALVEQLARRGREGLEDLPRLLSISYGRCSEYVADLGGEVLYFAGDSLLAYWAAETDQLGSAVRSAVDCAELICKNGNDRGHRAANEITPALHIGIGAGRLWAAALGEQPVWNLVAGGEAVTQAAAAQAVARSWGSKYLPMPYPR